LLFDHEDGSDKFLRNFELTPNYAALQLRRQEFSEDVITAADLLVHFMV
jgi:hypothetical protein